ncbi:MAG: helix-turn-helix domain-containing protein [Arenibacterium sp.]
MDNWDLRRRNLKVILALKDTNPTEVARKADVSVNTVAKFIRGESKTMRWDTLEAVCKVLEISNPAVLDAENPFSNTKNQLYEIIEELSDDGIQSLLAEAKKLKH